MSLPTSSRYQTITEEKDNTVVLAANRKKFTFSSYLIHVAVDGQTFSSLAELYFGNESLFWIIADTNPQIKFPDVINAGTSVRVPIL